MSAAFAERCAEAVKAVPHDDDCACKHGIRTVTCDCNRDARIGRGMAAMFEDHVGVFDRPGQIATDMDTARLAAFTEASR